MSLFTSCPLCTNYLRSLGPKTVYQPTVHSLFVFYIFWIYLVNQGFLSDFMDMSVFMVSQTHIMIFTLFAKSLLLKLYFIKDTLWCPCVFCTNGVGIYLTICSPVNLIVSCIRSSVLNLSHNCEFLHRIWKILWCCHTVFSNDEMWKCSALLKHKETIRQKRVGVSLMCCCSLCFEAAQKMCKRDTQAQTQWTLITVGHVAETMYLVLTLKHKLVMQ